MGIEESGAQAAVWVGATCLLLATAAPGLAVQATQGHVNWTFAFDGNAALKVSFHLTESSRLYFNNTQSWTGTDWEYAEQTWGWNADTGETRGTIAGVSSATVESGLNVGKVRVRGSTDALAEEHAYEVTWTSTPFAPGNWTFVMIRGVSLPAASTSFEVGLPSGVEPQVETTRTTGLLTNRDFEEGVSSFHRAAPGVTAAVALAESTVRVEKGLIGWATYTDTSPADVHRFTRIHGEEELELDFVGFEGDEAGDYVFRLRQASAGANWSGRAVVLWADFDLQPARP